MSCRRLHPTFGAATTWAPTPRATNAAKTAKTVAEKKWTDSAIPAGTAQASYRVRATNQAGPSEWSEPTTVFFAAPVQAAPGMLSMVGTQAA